MSDRHDRPESTGRIIFHWVLATIGVLWVIATSYASYEVIRWIWLPGSS